MTFCLIDASQIRANVCDATIRKVSKALDLRNEVVCRTRKSIQVYIVP